MTTSLFLIQYNNYFNRQVRRPNSYINRTTSYISGSSGIGAYLSLTDVNFNPADGVETSLILGKGEVLTVGQELDTYDYVLVYDNTKVLNTDNIISR